MELSQEFINKYNRPGPRYTSYPPANFFSAEIGNEHFKNQLIASNSQKPESISLYFHIPFCPHRCHFCGCHNEIGIGRNVQERYVAAMIKEIELTAKYLDKSRKVSQVHWGGGTPNSISYRLIGEIMEAARKNFTFADNAEIAMEVSPAYLEFRHIDQLAEFGFNRVSIGIQDFRDDVLAIVNRRPSKHPVEELVKAFRAKGFKGINLDLIYGLPLQTVESFKETVQKAIDISPDRLVTFSYAHVPWVKEYQKKLEAVGLPAPEDKIAMLINSLQALTEAGYVAIGMDHYAKPDDELAIALTNKKLHRNFQGYCTRETTGQVYGFGSSSISQLQGAYIQNHKDIKSYIDSVEDGNFAVERGYELSEKEQIVRDVINEVMCNAYLDFDEIAANYNTSADSIKQIVHYSPEKLKEFEEDNLLTIQHNKIKISDLGRMIVRNIAMTFDPALKTGEGVYSKTV